MLVCIHDIFYLLATCCKGSIKNTQLKSEIAEGGGGGEKARYWYATVGYGSRRAFGKECRKKTNESIVHY